MHYTRTVPSSSIRLSNHPVNGCSACVDGTNGQRGTRDWPSLDPVFLPAKALGLFGIGPDDRLGSAGAWALGLSRPHEGHEGGFYPSTAVFLGSPLFPSRRALPVPDHHGSQVHQQRHSQLAVLMARASWPEEGNRRPILHHRAWPCHADSQRLTPSCKLQRCRCQVRHGDMLSTPS